MIDILNILLLQDEKKKYDDETRKFCALQDKHFQLKNKTKEELLREVFTKYRVSQKICAPFA